MLEHRRLLQIQGNQDLVRWDEGRWRISSKIVKERAGKSVREISNGFEETVDDILDGKKEQLKYTGVKLYEEIRAR